MAIMVRWDAQDLISDLMWKRATVLFVLAAPSGRTQLLVWSLPSLCFRKTTIKIINKKSSALCLSLRRHFLGSPRRSNSITTHKSILSDDLCFSAGVALSVWGKRRVFLRLVSATAKVQVTFSVKLTTTISSSLGDNTGSMHGVQQ